jgi:hypothetical protein
MTNPASKRFYLALLIWTLGSLLVFVLSYAGVLGAGLESWLYTFVLGLLVLVIFFRPSKS